jgi:hypothetical protein
MAHCRITCINLSNSGKSHEHITHVGQSQSAGPVRWPMATVVDWINNGVHTFYVQDSVGRQADVRVVERSGLPSSAYRCGWLLHRQSAVANVLSDLIER